MPIPRYTMEEHARLAKAMYEEKIRPLVEAGNKGKIDAIDVDTGEYELGEEPLPTAKRLLARLHDAQIWCERIGHRGVWRFGARGQ